MKYTREQCNQYSHQEQIRSYQTRIAQLQTALEGKKKEEKRYIERINSSQNALKLLRKRKCKLDIANKFVRDLCSDFGYDAHESRIRADSGEDNDQKMLYKIKTIEYRILHHYLTDSVSRLKRVLFKHETEAKDLESSIAVLDEQIYSHLSLNDLFPESFQTDNKKAQNVNSKTGRLSVPVKSRRITGGIFSAYDEAISKRNKLREKLSDSKIAFEGLCSELNRVQEDAADWSQRLAIARIKKNGVHENLKEKDFIANDTETFH